MAWSTSLIPSDLVSVEEEVRPERADRDNGRSSHAHLPTLTNAPTHPIPFHKLLKIVAIVDSDNSKIRQLLNLIARENFAIEETGSFERDVSEDASVGAYVALIDGDRLERARSLVRAVRAVGFRTPLWAIADSHRISDISNFDRLGEVEGYIYLGQQSPTFYAKQVIRSVVL
jgi:ornithine decarboxylase